MKKFILFLCIFASFLSMIGCQSTNDEKIFKECGINLEIVLDNAYLEMEECVDKYAESLKFKKSDILNQDILYDEKNDEFHIVVTIKDELAGSYGERCDRFFNLEDSALSNFLYYYKFSLSNYIDDNEINENITFDVISESGEYSNGGFKINYKGE